MLNVKTETVLFKQTACKNNNISLGDTDCEMYSLTKCNAIKNDQIISNYHKLCNITGYWQATMLSSVG